MSSSSSSFNIHGCIWLYSGDTPYLSLSVGNTSFFINFTTMSYHVPVDDVLLTEDGKELDEASKKEFNNFPPMMKNMRFCQFYNGCDPVQKLFLNVNCGKYYIEYGSGNHVITEIFIEFFWIMFVNIQKTLRVKGFCINLIPVFFVNFLNF